MKNKLRRSEIYDLCNKYRWFTCGDNAQYNKMFEYSEQKDATLDQLAFIISFCSKDIPEEEVYMILLEEQCRKLIAEIMCLEEENKRWNGGV